MLQVGEESWRVKRSLTQSFRSLAAGSSQGSQRLALDQLARVAGHSRRGSSAASLAGSGPPSQPGSYYNSRASSNRNSLDTSRDNVLRHLAGCPESPPDQQP